MFEVVPGLGFRELIVGGRYYASSNAGQSYTHLANRRTLRASSSV